MAAPNTGDNGDRAAAEHATKPLPRSLPLLPLTAAVGSNSVATSTAVVARAKLQPSRIVTSIAPTFLRWFAGRAPCTPCVS